MNSHTAQPAIAVPASGSEIGGDEAMTKQRIYLFRFLIERLESECPTREERDRFITDGMKMILKDLRTPLMLGSAIAELRYAMDVENRRRKREQPELSGDPHFWRRVYSWRAVQCPVSLWQEWHSRLGGDPCIQWFSVAVHEHFRCRSISARNHEKFDAAHRIGYIGQGLVLSGSSSA